MSEKADTFSGVQRKKNAAGVGTPALQRRRHLRRLDRIFEPWRSPLFFLTICTRHRSPVLASAPVCEVLVSAWRNALSVYGWKVVRYVVMPDHVHFFATPFAEEAQKLSAFVGAWKHWTQREIRKRGVPSFAWQSEFFDHLMRRNESYVEKWEYVRLNPVRAELVFREKDWPYQGEIHTLSW